MLCEKCHQQQATVHMQQITFGEKTEMHLCQSCAMQIDTGLSFENIFQGFLNNFLSMQNQALSEKTKSTGIACPKCGLTSDGFRKTGRLGCGGCYQAFGSELESIFKNVQGSTQHSGKYPKKAGTELLLKREIDNLRLSLSKAIENEEYEEAAILRDKLKEFEKSQLVKEREQ